MFAKTAEISIERLRDITYKVWNIILFYFILNFSLMILKAGKSDYIYHYMYKYFLFCAPHAINLCITIFLFILLFGDIKLIDLLMRTLVDIVVICTIVFLLY